MSHLSKGFCIFVVDFRNIPHSRSCATRTSSSSSASTRPSSGRTVPTLPLKGFTRWGMPHSRMDQRDRSLILLGKRTLPFPLTSLNEEQAHADDGDHSTGNGLPCDLLPKKPVARARPLRHPSDSSPCQSCSAQVPHPDRAQHRWHRARH